MAENPGLQIKTALYASQVLNISYLNTSCGRSRYLILVGCILLTGKIRLTFSTSLDDIDISPWILTEEDRERVAFCSSLVTDDSSSFCV
ncbi:hypothetical protein AC579_6813 [Pseudocercospora musae]|uniref:Uncharacterized protein n=1 Tax=Pseudocercospora musae TaxID=113226 RepID=A0A139IPX2_9PEZI|nr:hypothetical protein AC579_6813 [Pseudocercospora musae]